MSFYSSGNRRANFICRVIVILLVPALVQAQVPPADLPSAAQETLDQLQDTPGLSINTAPECCDHPSIWDFLGYHDVHTHVHDTLQQIAELPLFASLLSTINSGLQMVGLAPPSPGGGLPGADGGGPGADGGGPGAGGPPDGAAGPAADIAQQIEADKQAADAKVQTLEYLSQQDCNTYPEIVPAILVELDDPNERVRYAALVALQRQCSELRCSTLPATRLRYRLHGAEFISRGRQCASCACQEQVIKRLSDLLLDKTALGHPKENSPRVRNLAAAIIERCLSVHPPDPDAPTGEVQPDPPPTPVPDPVPSDRSAASRSRFPQAPLLKGGFSQTGSWFRGFLGLGRRDRDGPTVHRGQEPEEVFNWDGVASTESALPEWNPVPAHPAEISAGDDGDSTGRSYEAEATLENLDERGRLYATLARAEQMIRESFTDRNDATREQFETATTELFEARLALALQGDSRQLDNLVEDTDALWANTPHTFAAVCALDALTRYYGALAGQPTAKRTQALGNYARCLGFQVANLELCPTETSEELLVVAESLLDANMVAEAVDSLLQVASHCADTTVASRAESLLARIEPRTRSAAFVETDTDGGTQAFASADDAPLEVSLSAQGNISDTPEDARSRQHTMGLPHTVEEPQRLYTVVAESERMLRETFAERDGAANDRFESALARLCEARLQLALRGDEEQFRRLHRTTTNLCAKSPRAASTAVAMRALTRYYESHSRVDSPHKQAALAQYANCLRYQVAMFDSVPHDVPRALFDAAVALLHNGMRGDAASCLQQILDSCPDSSVSRDASRMLAEIELPVQLTTGDSGDDAPPRPVEESRALNAPFNTSTPEPAPPAPDAPPPPEAGLAHGESDRAPPAPVGGTSDAEFGNESGLTRMRENDPRDRRELSRIEFEPAAGRPTRDSGSVQPTAAMSEGRSTPPGASRSPDLQAGTPTHAYAARVGGATFSESSGSESNSHTGSSRLISAIASAEMEIQATFDDRKGASQSRYEAAVAELCEARLQLALQGNGEQFHRLYDTTAALCAESPAGAAAAIAVDALTRYYQWHARNGSPQRENALPRYANCLRYQLATFNPIPAHAPRELLSAAEALLQLEMHRDAVSSLQRILVSCPGHDVASDAATLLAEIDAGRLAADPAPPRMAADADDLLPSVSADVLAADAAGQGPVWEPALSETSDSGEMAAGETAEIPADVRSDEPLIGDGEAGHPATDEPREQTVESSTGSIQAAALVNAANAVSGPPSAFGQQKPDPEVVAAAFHEQNGPENDSGNELERLYAMAADAEMEIQETFAERNGASRIQFETATAALCDARLQLALRGDVRQFENLYRDAESLCSEAPDSRAALFAMDALARYYASHSDETTPEGQDALRKYAGCLRYQVKNLGSHSPDTAHRLTAVAQALRRAGLEQDAISCLRVLAASSAIRDESGADPTAGAPMPAAAYENSQAPIAAEPSSAADRQRIEGRSANGSGPTESTQPEVVVRQRIEPTRDVVPADALAEGRNGQVSHAEAAPMLQSEINSEANPVVGAVLESPDPVSAADDATDDSDVAIDLETFLEAGLPSVAASQVQFVQYPPPAPPADGVGSLSMDQLGPPALVSIESVDDPFFPTPTGQSIYDRALDALEANSFAYAHLQEDDDIVERYNNSVGIEVAPFSLFHIYAAKPGNVFRFRFNSVWGYDRPDRSEYLWNRIGGAGPLRPETGLNYQQIYIYNETKAGEFASAFTEYPIWLLDPDQNSNTAGPGDIVIGVKAVVIQDENWTLSTITRTYTPVGVTRRGLGRRHLSLESGVAVQLRAGRRTYLHSDLRFHYPLGANDSAGELLIGGIGISRVLWSDPIAPPVGRSYALLLTAETVVTSFLDGLVTEPALFPVQADAEITSVIQNLGLRAVWTKRFSTGLSLGFPLSSAHLHDASLLLEFQWLH